MSWDRNSGNNQVLYLASSKDGGNSWTAPVKVNDGTSKFERVIGAYPAVDQATGVVYDSWHDYAKNIIYVDKSANGGGTWGKDVAAAITHAGFGADIGCVGGRSQGPAHALKVGPSGALYLVYADPVQGRGFDVLLTKSTNGGSDAGLPPSGLNSDTGAADQFHPTLSVEAAGTADKVTVSFYDRRDDPANCLAHVYATTSVNGGEHVVNQREGDDRAIELRRQSQRAGRLLFVVALQQGGWCVPVLLGSPRRRLRRLHRDGQVIRDAPRDDKAKGGPLRGRPFCLCARNSAALFERSREQVLDRPLAVVVHLARAGAGEVRMRDHRRGRCRGCFHSAPVHPNQPSFS